MHFYLLISEGKLEESPRRLSWEGQRGAAATWANSLVVTRWMGVLTPAAGARWPVPLWTTGRCATGGRGGRFGATGAPNAVAN